MRRIFTATAMAGLLGLGAGAQADNSTIENAIKDRPELSQFYQALLNTSVNHELSEDMSYTVFAPTNDAFAKIAPARYPCFYSPNCKAEVANIIRHHIVPGDVHVPDVAQHQGGVYSINHRFVSVAEPYRGSYSVDGNNVLGERMLGGSVLYRIDGVIASDYDLAVMEQPKYVPVATESTTTTTRKTVVDKVCPPDEECPDEVSTTITHTTTVTPEIAPPALAPAR